MNKVHTVVPSINSGEQLALGLNQISKLVQQFAALRALMVLPGLEGSLGSLDSLVNICFRSRLNSRNQLFGTKTSQSQVVQKSTSRYVQEVSLEICVEVHYSRGVNAVQGPVSRGLDKLIVNE